ncbi:MULTISPECIES: DUF1707 domain-containing protein [Actinoalloteichus]|uniref:DUF1707 family protein n=1 Tax=Actinoalloteichus fjordicus TaxID=1612552 RepID=A0AAC9PUV5_9PSEU|nr:MULTISPECIES: DUF1707 domain-containing protein [Actinoalloteichus]APU17512.1 putative DUF1707 family protein [Actinoalloteichus fjordicus]APU23589.1 putative DUF1707 family protein [Actinoalloteichus sp. GBA129-24]
MDASADNTATGKAGEPIAIRASNAERETYAVRLQEAFAEGRLDVGELDDRLARAYAAKTIAELTPLVADLPPIAGTPAAAGQASLAHPQAASIAAANGAGLHGPAKLRLQAGAMGLERSGNWLVPRRLVVESKYGSVKLDLASATIPHPEVEVALDIKYGGIDIILPPDATADIDGFHSKWGWQSLKVPSVRTGRSLHVAITGTNKYGPVTVRYPRGLW